jgi:ABC-2 type transport system permease protein
VNAVYRANAARAAARALLGAQGAARIPALAGLLSLLLFVALEVAGLEAAIRASAAALSYLPELRPMFLVERILGAAFGAAAALVLLGSLTTAVSTLFLSEELLALAVLPIPHRRLLARQASLTLLLASAPSMLLAIPALCVAASASRAPLLAASAGLLALFGLFLLAGSLGVGGALILVRLVPPRRARLFSALLSALGLSAALVGFRAARPERLLDPMEALGLLRTLGASRPPAPHASPVGWAARGAALGLSGDPDGLLPGALILLLGLAAAALVPATLAGVHRTVWLGVREASSGGTRPARRRLALSLGGVLLRAEAATVLRDVSTPAQLGSLAAVFLLDLLNVRLLPATDPTARDLVAGLQTGLSLFLVSALSLRFAYPAVSTDGRAAAVLRSLPLDPRRHLLARWAARALPAVAASLVLTGASLAVLRPAPATTAAALLVALAGGLAIPALHTGLGALFPRYDASNPVAVALGPGGLFALVLSTGLALFSTLAVSAELRTLLSALLRIRVEQWLPLTVFLGAAAAAAAIPMALAARSLTTSDVSVG